MKRSECVFIVNMLQDVNVLRPLIYLAASDFDYDLLFLVSDRFVKRDQTKSWMAELAQMQFEIGARLHTYSNPLAATQALTRAGGIVFAGSESNLSAHSHSHDVLRSMPSNYLRVTLQHGFQCVGFAHSKEHDNAYGSDVRFAADVLCGWFPVDRMTSLHPTQREKLYVTGPQSVMLRRPPPVTLASRESRPGIVAENLHSLRFSSDVGRRGDFMQCFETFCAEMAERGETVALRPHPGGQYVVKNAVALPGNATLVNAPMYNVDLAGFAYGISAPSTVVLDMLLAGIPVAVWGDAGAGMDLSHYAGLEKVSDARDWMSFVTQDAAARQSTLERQERFLDDDWAIPRNPSDVRLRFARLMAGSGAQIRLQSPPARPARIIFISNAIIPTLSIFFLQPLEDLTQRGLVEYVCLTEQMFLADFPTKDGPEVHDWLTREIPGFKPDLVVSCRYNGPNASVIVDICRDHGIPIMTLMDDDLFNVPKEIGERKYKSYRSPPRRESLAAFMDASALIYCSTPVLAEKLIEGEHGITFACGDITTCARIGRRPTRNLRGKIGYMGFDHAHDLAMVLPAIEAVLEQNNEVGFELFGSIPKPSQLDRFGDRVTVIPPIRDYAQFVEFFAKVDWDIGICPLAPLPFNALKTSVKWVDYTAAGIAVVASAGTIYDECCAEGCGLLVDAIADWTNALQALLRDHDLRFDQVSRAQRRLETYNAPARFQNQMMAIFDLACGKRLIPCDPIPTQSPAPVITTLSRQMTPA